MSQQQNSAFFDSSVISATVLAIYRQGREADKKQEYGQAIRYYTDVISFELKEPLLAARTYEYRGQCHWLLGELAEAEKDYLASLNASDDRDQVSRARVRLGELADFRGQFPEAESLYRQALAEGMAAQNLLVIGRARAGLGTLNRRQGNSEQAIGHLTQALVVFRQTGEAREQASVLTSLGRTRHARGEYQHALTAHNEALSISRSLNDRWRIVQALNDIGECHQALYDIESALRCHEQGLQLANAYGASLLKPELQRNLGIDLVEQDRFEEGLNFLLMALEDSHKFGDREQEALVLYNLARAYLRRSRIDDAVHTVSELDRLAEELNSDRYRALAAFVRGELLFHVGKQAEAVTELNAAMLAAQTSVDRGVLWKLHAAMSHVVESEEIANVHRTIAADFIRQTAEPLQDLHLKSSFVYAPPVLAVLVAAGIDPDKL